MSYSEGDDEDEEEEADEVVPDGVEEVELARVDLEHKARAQKLIQDDIRKLSLCTDVSAEMGPTQEGDLWIISGGRSILVRQELPEALYLYECDTSPLPLLFRNNSVVKGEKDRKVPNVCWGFK